MDVQAPDRHALQLHRARARHLRRPEHARAQAGGRGFTVTISEYNRRYLSRYGDPEQIHVVHAGIDVPAYNSGPEPCRARGPCSALCVASLQEYKGHAVLLEALAGAPRRSSASSSTSWGRARSARSWRSRVGRLGLSRAGALPRAACPRTPCATCSTRADLLVLPSIVARDGQMEGLPVVLMEALASGVPVVATRLSGHPRARGGRRDGAARRSGRRRRSPRGARAGRVRRASSRTCAEGAGVSSARSTWPTARRGWVSVRDGRQGRPRTNVQQGRGHPLSAFGAASMTREEPVRMRLRLALLLLRRRGLPLVPAAPARQRAPTASSPLRVVGKVVVYRLPHLRPRASAGAPPGARHAPPPGAQRVRRAGTTAARSGDPAVPPALSHRASRSGAARGLVPVTRRGRSAAQRADCGLAGGVLAPVRRLEPLQPPAAPEPAPARGFRRDRRDLAERPDKVTVGQLRHELGLLAPRLLLAPRRPGVHAALLRVELGPLPDRGTPRPRPRPGAARAAARTRT